MKIIFPKIFITILISLVSSPSYSQNDSCSHCMNKNLVSADYEIIKLFSGGFFTEGPTASLNGNVYFSDLTFTSETEDQYGHIWCYSEMSDTTVLFKSPSNMSNGLLIDDNGNLIIAEGADQGGRRISSMNLQNGEYRVLSSEYNGRKYNSPNDLTLDKNGNIYFTDPRYVGNESIEQDIMGVYRLSHQGNVSLVIRNISMPNGIALSPDGSKLYVGCYDESANVKNNNLHSGMFIASYRIDSKGLLSFDKKVIQFGSPVGPDGIDTDKDGNLYVAVRDEEYPHLAVYCSHSKLLTKISLSEVPSNLCFGKGIYSDRLYITAGKSLYRINLHEN